MISPRLRRIFRKFREGTHNHDFGRDVVLNLMKKYIDKSDSDSLKVLDIGVGSGIDLENIKNFFNTKKFQLWGMDINELNLIGVREKGIIAHCLDIEREKWPFRDEFFDIVVANQIIEHTKEIFFVFSEISRVLRVGGIVIVGVPNLASLHCRVLLLLGEQPPCIEMLGSHVRGISKNAFTEFVETNGYKGI